MADRTHPVSEFGQFPWGDLRGAWWNQFNIGMCELDMNGATYLRIVNKELEADDWEMPQELVRMLRYARQVAAREAKASIRAALGIQD